MSEFLHQVQNIFSGFTWAALWLTLGFFGFVLKRTEKLNGILILSGSAISFVCMTVYPMLVEDDPRFVTSAGITFLTLSFLVSAGKLAVVAGMLFHVGRRSRQGRE